MKAPRSREPHAVRLLLIGLAFATIALFLLVPFAGFVAVRWLWQREDLRGGSLALVALAVPIAAFVAWLFPVIGDTASVIVRQPSMWLSLWMPGVRRYPCPSSEGCVPSVMMSAIDARCE